MSSTATRQKQQKQARPAAHEVLVNDAPRSFSDAEFPIGTVAHQGDLILIRIAALPASAKRRKDRQLAQGSTQGSRHVLKRGIPYDCDAAEVIAAISAVCPKISVSRAYVGPVFQTRGGSADLVHPEHGNHSYRGDLAVAVVYQRNLDAEQRERRVQD